MSEYKVGEEFNYDNIRLHVEKRPMFNCENCYFKTYGEGCIYVQNRVGSCTGLGREDDAYVKFVKRRNRHGK